VTALTVQHERAAATGRDFRGWCSCSQSLRLVNYYIILGRQMIETYDACEFINHGQLEFRVEGEVHCSREVRDKLRIIPLGLSEVNRSFQLHICDDRFSGIVVFGIGPGKHKCVIDSAGSINATINMWRNSDLWIGQRTTINNSRIIMDNANLRVGEDNLWSDEIIIQTNDQHGVHDLDSGNLLDSSRRNMIIEEHVWIGRRAMIMPDIRIGCGSIIGAGSIVTRDVERFSIAVGNPARVVRKNSTWSRSPSSFSKYEEEWVRKNKCQ